MARAMSMWGYGPVETPVVESEETVNAGLRTARAETSFRLIDSDGKLLVLRPDMTMPIARLVATRLKGDPGPHRLRYVADVFREGASLRGQSREFTQIGLELIGVSGAAGDAEVIGALVESLRAAGIDSFVVAVGNVAVFTALIEAADMSDEWSRKVLAAAHDRDLVGLDTLAETSGVPADVRDALKSVPRIRGGADAIDICRRSLPGDAARDALDSLAATWELLDTIDASRHVSIDFGIMRSFDYYTGMVLEVYVPGLGLPIGGGGRYDALLGEFGCPSPAAGFAVGLERLHIAVADSGAGAEAMIVDEVVGGEARDAFLRARTMREQGRRVALAVDGSVASEPVDVTMNGDTDVRR